MQFTTAVVAAMALAMANAVSFTNPAFNGITAGQPITLTWTDASGPVTITLKNGPSTDLKTVSTVASGQSSGSFTWNVPATLTQDTYALEITDSTGTPNYSPQFELIGGAAAVSSILSSAVSSVTSVLASQSSSLSSVASSVSSVIDAITSNSTSSAAPSSTGSSNATTTSGSTTKASSTGSKTSAGTSSTPTTVPNSNSAVQMASPLALVFLTFAAILSLN